MAEDTTMLQHVIALLFAVACSAQPVAQPAPATDWLSTGVDCSHFAVGDIDADGFGDVLTINGSRQLCAAPGVRGWKASWWIVLAEPVDEGVVALIASEFDTEARGAEAALIYPDHAIVWSALVSDKLTVSRRVVAPEGTTFSAGSTTGDCVTDTSGTTWRLTQGGFERAEGESATHDTASAPTSVPAAVTPPPYEPDAAPLSTIRGDITGDSIPDTLTLFACSRPYDHRVLRMAPGLNSASGDADSDGLTDDDEARLGSNPADRDTDADGLLDGWEVHGLPRGVRGPDTALHPARQDVIVAVAPYAQVGAEAARNEVEKSKRLYAEIRTANPDGSSGITLHLRYDPEVPESEQGSGAWYEVGARLLEPNARGLMHWMQVGPGGGGQAQQTGDMGGSGNHWASFAHEVGHQLSLSHEGDSIPPWCPLYPSLMSYAFSYALGGDGNAIRFSDGRFAGVELREDALTEKLPFPPDQLAYLTSWPFRYTIAPDASGGSLIDWNHNGRFDEQPVRADINYGGSTNAGLRRYQTVIGAAPALGYVGDTCLLATLDQTQSTISVRTYLGDERWSEPRAIPNSATNDDPVLITGPTWAYVFFRQQSGWYGARVSADECQTPVYLPDLPRCDLSGVAVGDRLLLLSRHSDDRLEARWLSWRDTPVVTQGHALETRSQVPPGMAPSPADERIALATSMTNSHGTQMSLRVTWLSVQGDRVREGETLWTRGEGSGNSCAARPAVVFTPEGELNIYHAAWPAPSGLMTCWRTRRVENGALDEGWLTAMMYDEWTLTRVPPAAAIGPQGAIYAFRWDPGEYGEVHVNHLGVAHNALGIDPEPMRDFDDGAKISRWGIRHSILYMSRDAAAP